MQHRELCSVLCGSLDRRGVWGRMDTCVCMVESLCCSPETTTVLLISCAPIQNKSLKKKRHQRAFSLLTTWTPRGHLSTQYFLYKQGSLHRTQVCWHPDLTSSFQNYEKINFSWVKKKKKKKEEENHSLLPFLLLSVMNRVPGSVLPKMPTRIPLSYWIRTSNC